MDEKMYFPKDWEDSKSVVGKLVIDVKYEDMKRLLESYKLENENLKNEIEDLKNENQELKRYKYRYLNLIKKVRK